MYVLVTPATASSFTDELASLTRKHGLSPNVGRATDDKGHTLHVLEAKGRWMRLWSQNMPLSGQEDPTTCGQHAEPYPDPGQYVVVIEPTVPLLGGSASMEVAAQLRQELLQLGYGVREKPAVCSSLAIPVAGSLSQLTAPAAKGHRISTTLLSAQYSLIAQLGSYRGSIVGDECREGRDKGS